MYRIKLLPILFSLLLGVSLVGCGSGKRAKNQITDRDKAIIKAQRGSDNAARYLRYLNEKDVDRILSLYADNATIENPVGSDVLLGKVSRRVFYTNAVLKNLLATKTGEVRVAGNEVAFPYQLRKNVDGVPTMTDVIDIFVFDDTDKIISMRSFWGPFNEKPANE